MALLTAALVALVLFAVPYINVRRYKSTVAETLSRALGREIERFERAADQLEREVGLPGACALGWPGANDVRDLLDHILEVLALGLIVGREVELVQRIRPRAAVPRAANCQQEARRDEQREAGGDQLSDLGEQRERARTAMPRCGGLSGS